MPSLVPLPDGAHHAVVLREGFEAGQRHLAAVGKQAAAVVVPLKLELEVVQVVVRARHQIALLVVPVEEWSEVAQVLAAAAKALHRVALK